MIYISTRRFFDLAVLHFIPFACRFVLVPLNVLLLTPVLQHIYFSQLILSCRLVHRLLPLRPVFRYIALSVQFTELFIKHFFNKKFIGRSFILFSKWKAHDGTEWRTLVGSHRSLFALLWAASCREITNKFSSFNSRICSWSRCGSCLHAVIAVWITTVNDCRLNKN